MNKIRISDAVHFNVKVEGVTEGTIYRLILCDRSFIALDKYGALSEEGSDDSIGIPKHPYAISSDEVEFENGAYIDGRLTVGELTEDIPVYDFDGRKIGVITDTYAGGDGETVYGTFVTPSGEEVEVYQIAVPVFPIARKGLYDIAVSVDGHGMISKESALAVGDDIESATRTVCITIRKDSAGRVTMDVTVEETFKN